MYGHVSNQCRIRRGRSRDLCAETSGHGFLRHERPTNHMTAQGKIWECHDSLAATYCAIWWKLAVANKFRDYLLESTFTVFTDTNLWLTWKPRWSRQLQTSSVIICWSQPSGSSQMGLTIPWLVRLGAIKLQWAAKLADFELTSNEDVKCTCRYSKLEEDIDICEGTVYGHKAGDKQELHGACVNRVH